MDRERSWPVGFENFRVELQYGRRVMSRYATGIEKSGTMGGNSSRFPTKRIRFPPNWILSYPEIDWRVSATLFATPRRQHRSLINDNQINGKDIPGQRSTASDIWTETCPGLFINSKARQRMKSCSTRILNSGNTCCPRRLNTSYGEIEAHWSRPWQWMFFRFRLNLEETWAGASHVTTLW
jgi:hypothetical protein